ncbi:MAG: hypothetical protein RO257_07730 [Candidatus Kapabacteria bacterium]|nr:hypothetical protein [Candidatus Kapabacteria bacterium]
MIQKIYIPKNFAVPEIIGNIENVCHELSFELVKADEKLCIEHMLLNKGSLALLSPLGYGLGVGRADFRIIPTYSASLVGYTGKASLYFKEGMSSLKSIATDYPDDFIINIGKILLSERYDIESPLVGIKGSLPEMLAQHSAALRYGVDEDYHSMDVSEDWFETFDIPLPIGFWVVRNEEEPANVMEFTKKFALDDLPEEIEIKPHAGHNQYDIDRQGFILTRWNDESKSALEQTLEFLYYHRLLPELPAVKIFQS